MLNDSNYYTLYMAKLRRDELLRIAEIDRMNREYMEANKKRATVLTFILKGAGNALVNTGNRLLASA